MDYVNEVEAVLDENTLIAGDSSTISSTFSTPNPKKSMDFNAKMIEIETFNVLFEEAAANKRKVQSKLEEVIAVDDDEKQDEIEYFYCDSPFKETYKLKKSKTGINKRPTFQCQACFETGDYRYNISKVIAHANKCPAMKDKDTKQGQINQLENLLIRQEKEKTEKAEKDKKQQKIHQDRVII